MSKLQRRAVLKGLAAMPIVFATRKGRAAEAGPLADDVVQRVVAEATKG